MFELVGKDRFVEIRSPKESRDHDALAKLLGVKEQNAE